MGNIYIYFFLVRDVASAVSAGACLMTRTQHFLCTSIMLILVMHSMESNLGGKGSRRTAASFLLREACSGAVTGCSGAGGLPAGLASQSAPAAAACETAQLAAQSAELSGRML